MQCSSNSIIEDSIRLQLFQCTLTRAIMKWYVHQPRATHSTLVTLATTFLSYFHLPLHYDTDTKLLTSFHQNFSTHLSDHVQEWRRRRSICRAHEFEDRIYMDWFLRLLLAPIAKYVTSHFPQSEEEALQITLKFNLIYAQSGYFYIIIPNLPRPGAANVSGASHAASSIVGTISPPHPFSPPHMIYGHP